MKKEKKKEKKKAIKKWVLQQQVISAIRRLFVRSPIFQAIKKANRRQYKAVRKDGTVSDALRWEYKCACCGKWIPEKIKGKLQIAIDHINPVVSTEDGFVDLGTYIDRMFAGFSYWDEQKGFDIDIHKHFQILCENCHAAKSKTENKERRAKKDLKKIEKQATNETPTKGDK